MKTRPYQEACEAACNEAWLTHQSILVVLPTGTGKSVIFSELVRRMHPKRSLVLANRGELLFQAARHVGRTGLSTSVEKAELSAPTAHWKKTDVVVASVQTLVSKNGLVTRMHKFNPKEFGLIVCDEAHLFLAPSFRSILNYFKNGNPEIKIFGCTATPDRTDESALGKIFEHCAYRYEVADAIADGWLVPVYPLGLAVEGLDFSRVRTTAGDLNGADLAAVMEAEKPLYGIAQGTLEQVFSLEANALYHVPVDQWNAHLLAERVAPRSALVFTVSVKHAEMMAGILNRVVPDIAAWVHGKTPQIERDRINESFKSGETPVLVNCGTHTTGFDAPKAEIIVPKPTKSRLLFCQMVGRGFRPAEAGGNSIVDQYETAEDRKEAISHSRKPRVLVLDFHGVSGRHKLVTPFDILGGRYSDEVRELAVKKARQSSVPVDMTEAMKQAELELHERINEARRREAARRSGLVVPARFQVLQHDLFDPHNVTHVSMAVKPKKVVTEGMARVLRRMGVDPYSLPYERALHLMREQFARWNKNKPRKNT